MELKDVILNQCYIDCVDLAERDKMEDALNSVGAMNIGINPPSFLTLYCGGLTYVAVKPFYNMHDYPHYPASQFLTPKT